MTSVASPGVDRCGILCTSFVMGSFVSVAALRCTPENSKGIITFRHACVIGPVLGVSGTTNTVLNFHSKVEHQTKKHDNYFLLSLSGIDDEMLPQQGMQFFSGLLP